MPETFGIYEFSDLFHPLRLPVIQSLRFFESPLDALAHFADFQVKYFLLIHLIRLKPRYFFRTKTSGQDPVGSTILLNHTLLLLIEKAEDPAIQKMFLYPDMASYQKFSFHGFQTQASTYDRPEESPRPPAPVEASSPLVFHQRLMIRHQNHLPKLRQIIIHQPLHPPHILQITHCNPVLQ